MLQNNNALREVCTEQEQQLDDSEVLRTAYEVQIEQGKQEVARLSRELQAIQADFKSKTQEAEELRASKKVVQEILDELKEEAALRESDAVEDIKELKAQVQEARRQNETLLLQV
jgi:chromosome segregation ATPase